MGSSSWQLRISSQQAVDREARLLSFYGIAFRGLPIVHCIRLTKELASKIGVVDDRTSTSDYDNDMQQAKAAGIDAFALNIGIDGFTSTQLDFAYESAHSNGMSVFISFDFNWYSTSNTSGIADTIGTYAGYPAQLLIDNKVFVSSFSGDGLDLAGVQSDLTAHEIFWAPNFQPNNIASADALFNWMAWPNNGDNKAPDAGNNLTVSEGDTSYTTALKGKPYVARKLSSPHQITDIPLIGLMQPSLPGSRPTSALRSNTAKIGSFLPTFFGSIAGLRS